MDSTANIRAQINTNSLEYKLKAQETMQTLQGDLKKLSNEKRKAEVDSQDENKKRPKMMPTRSTLQQPQVLPNAPAPSNSDYNPATSIWFQLSEYEGKYMDNMQRQQAAAMWEVKVQSKVLELVSLQLDKLTITMKNQTSPDGWETFLLWASGNESTDDTTFHGDPLEKSDGFRYAADTNSPSEAQLTEDQSKQEQINATGQIAQQNLSTAMTLRVTNPAQAMMQAAQQFATMVDYQNQTNNVGKA